MLTKKDYCDYDTCVALRELGYDGCCAAYYHLFDDEDDARNSFEYACGFDFQNSNNIYRVGAPLLYQAQKWLREEKNIIVYPEKNYFGWYYTIHYNVGGVHQLKFSDEYDSYEEAHSEGVREAIKFLKENETIHR